MSIIWAMYVVVFGALGVLALRDGAKAKQVVRVAIKSFLSIFPLMLAMVGLIGLLLGLVPPDVISHYLGQGAGWGATVAAALIGAVMYIPSLIAFPLAASLLHAGAGTATVAAFLTALVMVGTFTLPLPGERFRPSAGRKRNGVSEPRRRSPLHLASKDQPPV